MMSQTGQQIITIHILPNISRTKDNPTMKFGEIIKYSMRNIFVKKHAKYEIGKLVPELFLFFKISFI